jgi:fimbrial isopeptide formation D2 family protein/LPXTG-motif cell wall-anchored protein
MKTMRKLFTVLLALAMTLALAVPAFAADTGSITITNPQGDHTYTAYKIFDVTYSGDNYSYTISGTDAAFNTVKAYADEAANGLKLTAVANTNKYNVSIDAAAFSAASFAQYLKTNVGSLGTGTAFTKDGDTMKASGLTPGYYFVSGTSGTVCELATAKDIEIRDKNEAPQIEKSVDDADRTVEIGQKLTYTITGKVPSTKGYTKFTYQVTDTMSEGLTFNKDVKVTIGGTAVTDAAITYNDNGFEASINMMNYQKQIDAPVVITYTATVNENAIQRDKETNTATLKYSNDPADKNSFKESSVEVNVFSFNIVINKYAADNESTKLEGAKFVLKNAEGKYYKYDANTKAVTWVVGKADATEVTTDTQGVARFDGLQAGTYKLEETAAPAGYNQLTKDITIVLNKDGSATIDSASSTLGADHSLTAGVANSTGTMLPETGGIGTVIFVALGALAVICAGVFLVTNKRMSKESF